MSGADYYHCPICNTKALYDASESEDMPDVEVLHGECFTKVKAALDAAAAVVRVWRTWERGQGKVTIPVKALAAAVDVLAFTPVAEAFRGEASGTEELARSADAQRVGRPPGHTQASG